MRSDGFVEASQLRKSSCLVCGSAFRRGRSAFHRARSGAAYTLNAKPDNSFDRRRHEGYAHAIAQACGAAPAKVIDVGCGNGALLDLLRERWQETQFCGVEPASLPREHATRRGFETFASLRPGLHADLVISVNVLEHTPDPGAFLRDLSGLVPTGGRCVLIWPDGQMPSTELLFNDHLFTLSNETVAWMSEANRWKPVRPLSVLQGFQGLMLRRHHLAAGGKARRAPRVEGSAVGLARDRSAYLRRWAALDQELLPHIDTSKQLIAFGGGEVAQLLRAYAPRVWGHVQAITADEPVDIGAFQLAYRGLDEIHPATHQLLLATHPRAHAMLRGRLQSAGFDCIAWNHLIEG
jgi:SAM-dependent methyltransferase